MWWKDVPYQMYIENAACRGEAILLVQGEGDKSIQIREFCSNARMRDFRNLGILKNLESAGGFHYSSCGLSLSTHMKLKR